MLLLVQHFRDKIMTSEAVFMPASGPDMFLQQSLSWDLITKRLLIAIQMR